MDRPPLSPSSIVAISGALIAFLVGLGSMGELGTGGEVGVGFAGLIGSAALLGAGWSILRPTSPRDRWVGGAVVLFLVGGTVLGFAMFLAAMSGSFYGDN